jgi:type II secretory pathway pseudopilin PulG
MPMHHFDYPGRGRRQEGFSYVWVLFLVALMGLGLTVATDLESTATQRDKEKELLSIGRQFRTALASYYGMHGSNGMQRYPGSLDDLVRDSRVPGVKRHLRKVFVDPMTGKAEWGLVKIGGRITGVHSLSDRKPIKRSGFDEEMDFGQKNTYAEWVFSYSPGSAEKNPVTIGRQ